MPGRSLRAWVASSALLAQGFAGCGEPDAGSDVGSFESSLAGPALLSELSNAEARQLCDEATRFRAAEMRRPRCQLDGVQRALEALNDPQRTDEQLRDNCDASECVELGPDPANPPSIECAPPANCRASVADITACLTDQARALHELEARLPACSSVSRQSLSGVSLGSLLGRFLEPLPSCEKVASVCSGASAEVQSFAERYCAAVSPCCQAQGLGSSCVLSVLRSSLGEQYAPSVGEACLAELSVRQSEADFCDELALDVSFTVRTPRFSTACGRQFFCSGDDCTGAAPATSVSLGQPCHFDAACLPGARGPARCVYWPGAGQVCLDTSASVGAACLGTDRVVGRVDPAAPVPTAPDALCDRARGVFCDLATGRCTPTQPLGGACSTDDTCDDDAFCNGNTGVCQALPVAGQPCELGACQGDSYCDRTTERCTLPIELGAACATGPGGAPEQCRPGFCQQGVCVSSLANVCNTPTE